MKIFLNICKYLQTNRKLTHLNQSKDGIWEPRNNCSIFLCRARKGHFSHRSIPLKVLKNSRGHFSHIWEARKFRAEEKIFYAFTRLQRSLVVLQSSLCVGWNAKILTGKIHVWKNGISFYVLKISQKGFFHIDFPHTIMNR